MTQLGHRLNTDDFDDSRAVPDQTVGAGRRPSGRAIPGPDAARVARRVRRGALIAYGRSWWRGCDGASECAV